MQDLVVGLAFGGVHQEGVLLAPLLEPLDTLEHNLVGVHNHRGDLVFEGLGLVMRAQVDKVELEALVGVEEDQPGKLYILQEPRDSLVRLAERNDLFLDLVERDLAN